MGSGEFAKAWVIYSKKEESTGYDQSDKSNAEPNKYYLMVEGDGVGITPINYCPVCGRNLNK